MDAIRLLSRMGRAAAYGTVSSTDGAITTIHELYATDADANANAERARDGNA